MERLNACYYSSMRLYPLAPHILTPGKWRWCPPGAKVLPFPHAFGSFVYDPGEIRIDPSLGEIPRKRGRTKGHPSPRILGRNWCGGVELYQGGSPLSLQGTPLTDEDGIPFCCISGPSIAGGAECDGLDQTSGPEDGAVELELPDVFGEPGQVGVVEEELPDVGPADAMVGVVELELPDVFGEPGAVGVTEYEGLTVSPAPVFATMRSGVRLTAWTGRNDSPTAILRVGVRLTAWTGYNDSPTAILRSGVRLESS